MRSIRITNLPPYSLSDVAKRVQTLRMQGKDVIDCSQLNPTLNPPQIALDRLIEASLLPHNHRYTSSIGLLSLRQAISNYYQVVFCVNVSHENQIVVTHGSKEACLNILLSVISPGDTVLIPVPAYPIHTAHVTMAGGSFIGVPLWKNYNDYKVSEGILSSKSDYFFSRLENRYKQTWPRPKVVLTSFPHNPTATIVSKCFYDRLKSFALDHSLLLINDFAHGDLFYRAQDVVSILGTNSSNDSCLEIYSISKGHSLAGWRVGAVLGDENYVSVVKELNSYTGFGIFQPIQIATAKFLGQVIKDNQHYSYRENAEIYSERHALLNEGLGSLGFTVTNSRAGSMIWVELPERYKSLGADRYCMELLEKAHVAFSPGTGFDSEQANILRISLSEPERRIREIIKRIEQCEIN